MAKNLVGCNPSISCIIPAYNSQDWIREAIESAINQTIAFDEIILINDGSIDQTFSICEEYSSKYFYIKLISHENKGLAACRNEGLAFTSCDYVMFLDSDDLFARDTIEQLLPCIGERPDCIYFDAEIFGDHALLLKGGRYERLGNTRIIKASGKDFFEHYYPNSFIACAPLAVYKKSFLEKENIVFPNGIVYEDNLFSFKCVIMARSIIYLPEKLYKRRLRAGSITTTEFDKKKLHDLLACAGMIIDFVLGMDVKKLSNEIVRYILNWGTILAGRYTQCKTIRTDAEIKEVYADVILGICNVVLLFSSNGEEMNVIKTYLFQILSFCKCEDIDKDGLILDEYEKIYPWAKGFYSHFYEKTGLITADKKEIAVYGVGKYTRAMTKVYEQLLKKKMPKVIFIDKNKAGEVFGNSSIKNLEDVGKIERVIVSILSPESYRISEHIREMLHETEIINIYDMYPYNLFMLDEYLFI